jgi:hypothetical protein
MKGREEDGVVWRLAVLFLLRMESQMMVSATDAAGMVQSRNRKRRTRVRL